MTTPFQATTDEVPSIVLDVGSHLVRAGFAGEDNPKAVFPSFVGHVPPRSTAMTMTGDMMVTDDMSENKTSSSEYYVGSRALNFRRDFMEIESPFNHHTGLLENFDHVERLVEHTVQHRLRVKSSDQPILVGEVPHNTRPCREKLITLLMEQFQFPAVYLVKNPVLTCFAHGKSSGLVVDSGASGTSVTAVVDGYALSRSVVRNLYGGSALNDVIVRMFRDEKGVHELRAPYMYTKKKKSAGSYGLDIFDPASYKNTADSYRRFAVSGVVDELKEALFRVYDNAVPFDPRTSVFTRETFTLNDDTQVDIGPERYSVPETLFTPSTILEKTLAKSGTTGTGASASSANSATVESSAAAALDATGTAGTAGTDDDMTASDVSSVKAMHLLAYESIMRCDTDIRRDLYGSVLLTGGNTHFPGLSERFTAELQAKAPQAVRVRTVAPSSLPTDCKSSAWIGGSILASLGTFQQMWISREEYMEHGAAIVHKKCA